MSPQIGDTIKWDSSVVECVAIDADRTLMRYTFSIYGKLHADKWITFAEWQDKAKYAKRFLGATFTRK